MYTSTDDQSNSSYGSYISQNLLSEASAFFVSFALPATFFTYHVLKKGLFETNTLVMLSAFTIEYWFASSSLHFTKYNDVDDGSASILRNNIITPVSISVSIATLAKIVSPDSKMFNVCMGGFLAAINVIADFASHKDYTYDIQGLKNAMDEHFFLKSAPTALSKVTSHGLKGFADGFVGLFIVNHPVIAGVMSFFTVVLLAYATFTARDIADAYVDASINYMDKGTEIDYGRVFINAINSTEVKIYDKAVFSFSTNTVPYKFLYGDLVKKLGHNLYGEQFVPEEVVKNIIVSATISSTIEILQLLVDDGYENAILNKGANSQSKQNPIIVEKIIEKPLSESDQFLIGVGQNFLLMQQYFANNQDQLFCSSFCKTVSCDDVKRENNQNNHNSNEEYVESDKDTYGYDDL